MLEKGGRLAAGNDKGIQGIELAGFAHERGQGAQTRETVSVDVECALKSQDADGWRFRIHYSILVYFSRETADVDALRKR